MLTESRSIALIIQLCDDPQINDLIATLRNGVSTKVVVAGSPPKSRSTEVVVAGSSPESRSTEVVVAESPPESRSTETVRKEILSFVREAESHDHVFCCYVGPVHEHGKDFYFATKTFDIKDVAIDPCSHLSFAWLYQLLFVNPQIKARKGFIGIDLRGGDPHKDTWQHIANLAKTAGPRDSAYHIASAVGSPDRSLTEVLVKMLRGVHWDDRTNDGRLRATHLKNILNELTIPNEIIHHGNTKEDLGLQVNIERLRNEIMGEGNDINKSIMKVLSCVFEPISLGDLLDMSGLNESFDVNVLSNYIKAHLLDRVRFMQDNSVDEVCIIARNKYWFRCHIKDIQGERKVHSEIVNWCKRVVGENCERAWKNDWIDSNNRKYKYVNNHISAHLAISGALVDFLGNSDYLRYQLSKRLDDGGLVQEIDRMLGAYQYQDGDACVLVWKYRMLSLSVLNDIAIYPLEYFWLLGFMQATNKKRVYNLIEIVMRNEIQLADRYRVVLAIIAGFAYRLIKDNKIESLPVFGEIRVDDAINWFAGDNRDATVQFYLMLVYLARGDFGKAQGCIQWIAVNRRDQAIACLLNAIKYRYESREERLRTASAIMKNPLMIEGYSDDNALLRIESVYRLVTDWEVQDNDLIKSLVLDYDPLSERGDFRPVDISVLSRFARLYYVLGDERYVPASERAITALKMISDKQLVVNPLRELLISLVRSRSINAARVLFRDIRKSIELDRDLQVQFCALIGYELAGIAVGDLEKEWARRYVRIARHVFERIRHTLPSEKYLFLVEALAVSHSCQHPKLDFTPLTKALDILDLVKPWDIRVQKWCNVLEVIKYDGDMALQTAYNRVKGFAYTEITRLDPERLKSMMMMTRVLTDDNDKREALKSVEYLYDVDIRSRETYIELCIELGNLSLQLEKIPEAIGRGGDLFNKIADHVFKNISFLKIEFHHILGLVDAFTGDPDEFKEMLEFLPANDEMREIISFLYDLCRVKKQQVGTNGVSAESLIQVWEGLNSKISDKNKYLLPGLQLELARVLAGIFKNRQSLTCFLARKDIRDRVYMIFFDCFRDDDYDDLNFEYFREQYYENANHPEDNDAFLCVLAKRAPEKALSEIMRNLENRQAGGDEPMLQLDFDFGKPSRVKMWRDIVQALVDHGRSKEVMQIFVKLFVKASKIEHLFQILQAMEPVLKEKPAYAKQFYKSIKEINKVILDNRL